MFRKQVIIQCNTKQRTIRVTCFFLKGGLKACEEGSKRENSSWAILRLRGRKGVTMTDDGPTMIPHLLRKSPPPPQQTYHKLLDVLQAYQITETLPSKTNSTYTSVTTRTIQVLMNTSLQLIRYQNNGKEQHSHKMQARFNFKVKRSLISGNRRYSAFMLTLTGVNEVMCNTACFQLLLTRQSYP